MSKGSTPPAPDYVGAAKEQGGANVDAAIAQGIINRPNEVTPLGSRTWDQTGSYNVGGRDVPMFTGNTTFTPTGQQLYDTNIATQQSLGDLGLQSANKAGNILGQQFDIGSIKGIGDTKFDRNSVRDALVARASEANTRDRDDSRSQLVAQGIPVGSEAYNREMGRLDRSMVDARQQSELGAGQAQQQELDARRQMISEALINRQTPLNEISALRSGSQVQAPQFQNYGGTGQIGGAPIANATNAAGEYAIGQSNASNAQSGQQTALLGSLATAAAMYF